MEGPTSMPALSDSTTTTGSPLARRSPSAAVQETILPSVMVELSAGMKISRILASTRHRRRDEDGAGAPARRRSADAEGRSVDWRLRRPAIAGWRGSGGEGEGKGAWRGGFERSLMRWWWLGYSSRLLLLLQLAGAAAALGVSEARRISRGRRGVERFGLVAAAANC